MDIVSFQAPEATRRFHMEFDADSKHVILDFDIDNASIEVHQSTWLSRKLGHRYGKPAKIVFNGRDYRKLLDEMFLHHRFTEIEKFRQEVKKDKAAIDDFGARLRYFQAATQKDQDDFMKYQVKYEHYIEDLDRAQAAKTAQQARAPEPTRSKEEAMAMAAAALQVRDQKLQERKVVTDQINDIAIKAISLEEKKA